jgi:hypothetical protein
MKKIIFSALAVGTVWACATTAVRAGQDENVIGRLEALEKENTAMRNEIAALRANKALHAQLATLKSSSKPQATAVQPVPVSDAKPHDPFGAYAADLPVAFKAPPPVEQGQFRVWGEGGAIWTGGDPNSRFFMPETADQALDFTGRTLATSSFDLKPKLGWEGAGGFDYRFAGSPWHVSGQFRYGEGNAQGSFAQVTTAGSAALAGAPNLTSFELGQSINATGTETHWLADFAIGRDVLGGGRDAMQLKAGLRISEFTANLNSIEVDTVSEGITPPVIFNGVPISAATITTSTNFSQHSRFLGAGPRIGIEGSVPFAGGWAFDYVGDGAALFGTQTFSQLTTANQVMNPPVVGAISASSSNTDQRSSTVFNADMQVGVSYWVSQNVKLSASYRLDAYFNVLTGLSAINDPTKLQTMDRYIHGPHVGVSATF